MKMVTFYVGCVLYDVFARTEKSPKILRFFNMAAEAHLSGGGKLRVVHLDPQGSD
jgi:hypothetical protein